MCRVADGEVEGVHLGATVSVLMAVGVCSGSGVGGAVPGVCLALDNGIGRMLRMKNGKMEGVHLRAAVNVCMVVGISSGSGVGDVVPDI